VVEERSGGLLDIEFVGNRFSRHQIRYLVGSAVATASGLLSVNQWQAALERAEPIPGVRAPADGLTLWEVHYPSEVDPFTADERSAAKGVPSGLPFAPDQAAVLQGA
jgi:tRNA pseudouridine38-40 synthase